MMAKRASGGAKKAPPKASSSRKKTPKMPVSKTTIRTFGKTACVKMARYYKERIPFVEVLSKEPRWNEALEMWEFDILKED